MGEQLILKHRLINHVILILNVSLILRNQLMLVDWVGNQFYLELLSLIMLNFWVSQYFDTIRMIFFHPIHIWLQSKVQHKGIH